jgi:CO/xanthine dehydrogenase FAD-binding subunit
MPREFDLLTPKSVPEALSMLADKAPNITPLAGGTNVIVNMRQDRCRYEMLMDLTGLDELRGIRRENGHLVLGSMTTVAELLEAPQIAEHASPLREAAAVFANPLVRNRATVGGNLVDASPAADTAPPLLALDAEVELHSQRDGVRRVPLDEFMVGVNETKIRSDELLYAIRWLVPPPHSAGGFYKIGLRMGSACSVVSAAVMIESGADGVCQTARIALGAVADHPMRAYASEEKLVGQLLKPEVVEAVGGSSAENVHPIDDLRGTAAYRRRMVDVLVRRLLSRAASELDQQE